METITNYDTHYSVASSAQLANFLAALPTGRIAVASIWGGISPSNRGCQSGPRVHWKCSHSQCWLYCDGWAIMGRKGAAPGSIPESSVPSFRRNGSSSVAVAGVMELRPLSCNVLYPLDCLMSGELCITET